VTRTLVELVERRRPDVVAFAIPLSLAVRIDRPLARAMRERVVPSADVSLETELWSSPLVQVRGTGECTLRAAAAAALWERLPTTADALRAIWSVYAACHAAAPPLIRLEERLAYLARLAALELPADDAGTPAPEAIDRELRAVVAAMSADETRRRDLAAWSARALARLPGVVRDSEAARILGAAVVGWVAAPPEVTALTPSLEGASLARRLAPPSAASRRAISVRRVGPRIEVIAERRDPPWVTLEIAASPFALYVDDDREVPLRRDGATAIDAGDRDVVLGDADGRRWLVPATAAAPPDLSGIAAVMNAHGPGSAGHAYLVEPWIAATSAHVLGDASWRGELWFASGPCAARAIAFDEDADCALLELLSPPAAAPLALADAAPVNAIWRAYDPDLGPNAPTPALVQRTWGRVAVAWPDLRIESEDIVLPRSGTPIFVGDRVIGHVNLAHESGAPSVDGDRVVGVVRPEPRQAPSPAGSPRAPIGLCDARTVARMLAQRGAESRSSDPIAAGPVATVTLQTPLSTEGLLSTRATVDDDGVPRLLHRTTGRRPWTIRLVRPASSADVGPSDVAVHIDASVARPDGRPALRIVMSAPSAGALGEAVRIAMRALQDEAHCTIDAPKQLVEIILPSFPGLAPAREVRRALRLVTEVLARFDPAAPPIAAESRRSPALLHVHIPGSRSIDVAQLDDRIAVTTHHVRVVEIDPDTEIVTIVAEDPDVGKALLERPDYPIARVYTRTGAHDTWHGAFGIADTRRGRRLSVELRGGEAELEVTSIDDRPLRGHVGFWVPRTIAVAPVRVRAIDGVARCRISRRYPNDFTAGAIVEDEGLPLEAMVPATSLLVNLVRERALEIDTTGPVWDCAVPPDGQRVLVACDDGLLRLLALRSSGRFLPFRRHEARVFGCAITPDGKRVVSASADRTVRVWDVESRRSLLDYQGHRDDVCACAVTPDGRLVVSVGEDRGVHVWDIATGKTRHVMEGHTGRICDCAVTFDGRRVVTASADATLRVWELETGRALRVLEGHADRVNGCSVTVDNRRVVSASYDHTLGLWDLESGRLIARLEGHRDQVQTCRVSPDGRWIASGSDDETLRLWEIEHAALRATAEPAHKGSVLGCAWTPDSVRIISVGGDGAVKLWAVEEGAFSGS
jgi:hypothetical protein